MFLLTVTPPAKFPPVRPPESRSVVSKLLLPPSPPPSPPNPPNPPALLLLRRDSKRPRLLPPFATAIAVSEQAAQAVPVTHAWDVPPTVWVTAWLPAKKKALL